MGRRGTWGTIQQRSSSSLFFGRPLWAFLAWVRMFTLWRCPSSICSADHGIAYPLRCPVGWFWTGYCGTWRPVNKSSNKNNENNQETLSTSSLSKSSRVRQLQHQDGKATQTQKHLLWHPRMCQFPLSDAVRLIFGTQCNLASNFWTEKCYPVSPFKLVKQVMGS